MTRRIPTWLGTSLFLAGSLGTLQAVRYAVSVYAARELGPETIGIWNLLNLIILYRGVTHLGALNAMNLEVPRRRGQEDPEGIEATRRTALGFTLVSSAVVAGLLALVAIALDLSLEARWALAATIALYLVHQGVAYVDTSLKSDLRFTAYGIGSLCVAIVLPVAAIAMLSRWKLPGYIAGLSVGFSAVLVLALGLGWVDRRPIYDRKRTLALVRIGWPIALIGVMLTLLTTVDRIVIGIFLGTREVGYYTLAILALALLSFPTSIFGQQFYPRMAEAYGRTGEPGAAAPWVRRQAAAGVACAVPLILAIEFVLPRVVERFLPAYVSGIDAMRVLAPALLFAPIAAALGNHLIVVDRRALYAKLVGVALAVNVVGSVGLVRIGWGIEGVALATAIAHVTLAALLIGARPR